jgi:DNA invertase Pin-like site-specific DNA recombinase
MNFVRTNSADSTRSGRRQNGDDPATPRIDSSVPCASYARFSSDMQRDESIAGQQRRCREGAAANGHRISPELEFSDEAVSGTKRHRGGLDAMLAAAAAGKFKVLYLYSLSRLSRESVITLPLLKALVYNHGVRVISLTEGIDSRDTAWELIAHIMSIVHEQYLKDLAESVLRGQEGAVLANFSVGDYCFGYASVPIPGSEQGRRGRKAKPRKLYVVDPETATWVQRIFRWFVQERQSLRWIARELNRLQAPKDHRAVTRFWRHQYLPRLLSNRKYLGDWAWGRKKNLRDPLTGKIRQVERPAEKCESWVRHLPHLQLIDQETFDAAQRLLKANQATVQKPRKGKGRFAGSPRGAAEQHPRHLLSGLIRCGECGRTFIVGDAAGRYLFYPGYAMGNCSCKTQLRRERAERMILEELGRRILSNPAWRQFVLDELDAAWRTTEAQLPAELVAVEKALAEVDRKVKALVDRIENGEPAPELDERLAQRRAERRELTGKLERLQRADQTRRPAPTEAWVDARLLQLGDLLRQANPAACHALRCLVGGQIVVREIRQPGRERHFLLGRSTITMKAVVEGLVGPTEEPCWANVPAFGGHTESVVIDFRETPEIEALSEQAKQYYDDGLMHARIAKKLGCARSCVTKLLRFWFQSRGLVMPDGRARRAMLLEKHLESPLYQEIAEKVMGRYEQGMLLQDIARDLHIDRNTVTAAIRYWHEARGLRVPDGRTRRKELEVKSSPREEMPSLDLQTLSPPESPSETGEGR